MSQLDPLAQYRKAVQAPPRKPVKKTEHPHYPVQNSKRNSKKGSGVGVAVALLLAATVIVALLWLLR